MELTASELLAELVRSQPDFAARKLSFSEKCGAFAALYGGAHNNVVARAFNVTPTTVSLLACCLRDDPDPDRKRLLYDPHNPNRKIPGGYRLSSPSRKAHYRDVAAEFRALGEQAFNDKYYRPIHDRLMAARREVKAKAPRVMYTGSNPAAGKYAFNNFGVISPSPSDPDMHFRVDWWRFAQTEKTGWYFGECRDDGKKLDENEPVQPHGDSNSNDPDDLPFRTSALACDAAYAWAGEESPRPRPGRPRRA